MRLIKVVLITPDESYNVQGDITNDLINELGIINKSDVLNVTDSVIEITAHSPMISNKIKDYLRTNWKSEVDFIQSAFSDGAGGGTSGDAGANASGAGLVSGGSTGTGLAASSGGTSDTSDSLLGGYKGIGNANLRGVSMIKYKDGKSEMNVDSIMDDPSHYQADEAPSVTYSDGEGLIYLPVTQEVYSLGSMTPTDVKFLNQQLDKRYKQFSSTINGNSGSPSEVERSVQIDYLKPNHNTYESFINNNSCNDEYISCASDKRSDTARDPERVPYRYNTNRDLIDIIHSGKCCDPNKSGAPLPTLSVPKMLVDSKVPDAKSELVQRLLCFSDCDIYEDSNYYVRQSIYSLTNVASKVVSNAVSKITGKVVSDATAKAGINTTKTVASGFVDTIKDRVPKAVNTAMGAVSNAATSKLNNVLISQNK